ncbi:MAG: hypothetical protein ACK4UJ_08655 [Leptonema sp. (in: bacteria)]
MGTLTPSNHSNQAKVYMFQSIEGLATQTQASSFFPYHPLLFVIVITLKKLLENQNPQMRHKLLYSYTYRFKLLNIVKKIPKRVAI